MTDQPVVPEPVRSFIDAVNRQDDTAFLGAFADDGRVDDWGRVFPDRDAIKAWSDVEFLGSHGTLTPEEVVVSEDGSTVDVVGDWRSSHANGRSRFTFTLAGDRIAEMRIREG